MRLVYKKTGKEVQEGDAVTLSRGEAAFVTFFAKPHKPSSEGKVSVKVKIPNGKVAYAEYYVSVIGAEWIEREDREGAPQMAVRDLTKKRTKEVEAAKCQECPNVAEYRLINGDESRMLCGPSLKDALLEFIDGNEQVMFTMEKGLSDDGPDRLVGPLTIIWVS